MQALERPWGRMAYRLERKGPMVVLSNSLGTDWRLWEALVRRLPPGLRVLRYDKRGHGLSDLGGETVSIEGLAEDAAALIETAGGGSCVFVGLSIGGLIGQALAAARPDLVRALVLVSTAAKIGTAEVWGERIAQAEAGGLEAIADGAMGRWFSPAFRATPELAVWRNMLVRTPAHGWIACGRAIAAADLTTSTAALRLPTLTIAGEVDAATPPYLVEATARLIPGAAFHVMPDVGHLPCVEAPEAMAAILNPFLAEHAR